MYTYVVISNITTIVIITTAIIIVSIILFMLVIYTDYVYTYAYIGTPVSGLCSMLSHPLPPPSLVC